MTKSRLYVLAAIVLIAALLPLTIAYAERIAANTRIAEDNHAVNREAYAAQAGERAELAQLAWQWLVVIGLTFTGGIGCVTLYALAGLSRAYVTRAQAIAVGTAQRYALPEPRREGTMLGLSRDQVKGGK